MKTTILGLWAQGFLISFLHRFLVVLLVLVVTYVFFMSMSH